jgi:sec-independent protein translocase protein TatB
MLPDIGGTELLVIAAVALIVVGPKDLPVLLRKLGQFVGRMRGMASEFRASFDEMARQTELDDLRKEVEAMRSGQYVQPFKDAAAAARDVGLDDTFAQIDASLNSGTIQAHPMAAYSPAPEPVLEAPKPKPKPKASAPRKPKVSVAPAAKAAPTVRKAAAKSTKTVAAPAAKASAKPAAKRASRAVAPKSDIVS